MKQLPELERAALVRTRLALERTLMAWLRTAIAMMAFGFTLYKAVQYASALEPKRIGDLFGVSWFGLIMIGMGLVALLLATLQNIRYARVMREIDRDLPVFSLGTWAALLFGVVGVFALLSALFRF